MEEMDTAIDIARNALFVTIKLSAPVLLIGLVVGIVISIIQVATSIQEQTLALIPKMFAVVATLFLIMPWLLTVLIEYTQDVFTQMIRWFP